jgi:hypothetical protein
MGAKKDDERKYYLWRLLVKARVCARNYEELQEVDEDERVPKLEQSVDALQEQYDQLTEGYLGRVERGLLAERQAVGGAAEAAHGVSRKRRIIDDSDDEEQSATKRQATEPLESAA